MEIKVRERALVKPAEKTPGESIWLSSVDLSNNHVYARIVYFYRPNGASNFFNSTLLKEALSKVLVPFYPMAGRFRHGNSGRLEIDCNDEGVLLVVADSSFTVDDFGDFAPTPELRKLIPNVEFSGDFSSYPFMVSQVTYFKCGGVSLGVGVEHHVVDGFSAFHIVSSWSHVARGLDPKIPPFLDRTILRPRDPPQPKFDHIEYQLPPVMKSSKQNTKSHLGDQSLKIVLFKVTREQLNTLRAKAKESGGSTIHYSTFEILGGHIWKCTCIARALPKDQETRFYFPVNGRYSRLKPPLPSGYFGSAVFQATSIAMAGDLQSKPLWYAVSRIHETLVHFDNDYLRSAIDYLELHPGTKRLGPYNLRSPNVTITSWGGMPTYDTDFGWGRPYYVGPGGILNSAEGMVYYFHSVNKEEGLFVAIALQCEHMKVFEKLFYECDDETKQVKNSVGRANL
ncbi:Transferase [Trema orientale]|uniref:Transferase n=1 Tax=Trema orientale TaxID=63057 RepID=A0A2P5EDU5_TREOI|nr:Transferase [Trema orientale]